MFGKEYEKAKEALEGKRDDVYPCREDVPADLWGKPIPKDKMPFKTPVQDLLNTGQIKDWDNVSGNDYNPKNDRILERRPLDVGVTSLKIEVDCPDYKFNEADILDSIQDYIDSTYEGHYNRNKFQATEFILDGGHGAGFCIGNILKYAQRYGKKGTPDDARKDLLKVVHYAIIALHNHDVENEKK